MIALQLLIICSLFLHGSFTDEHLVDYYIKLIKSEIERSQTSSKETDSQKNKPLTTDHIEYGTFDHVVIGAGSAGAIVASRLSEDPLRNVLLLEAGGPATNFTEIPGMGGYLLNMEYNWNYYTEPQTTSCLGLNERKCYYPRGKILGGSSGINGLLYTRGSKTDYNNWCAQGNPGWCYDDVLPFFKKSESADIELDPTYHGIDGYLNVEYAKSNTGHQRAFIEANRQLGLPFVDYNGYRQEGVGFSQMNTRNGRRSSSNDFLKAASGRSNLKVLTYSHVTRILINRKTKKAFGVVFAKDNKYYVARSRSDIVLSAGTVGSPQILMLSGVGPKHQLKQLRIPVIKDLSVGENLQDHVGYSFLHVITDVPLWDKSLENNIKDYLTGSGPLADGFNCKGITFLRTNLTKTDDFPDIEFLQIGTNVTSPLLGKLFNYGDDLYKYGIPQNKRSQIFSIFVFLMHPESRGSIRLKSADPFDYPEINSNLLSDPNFKDIETMYQGIQIALRLFETDAFKKVGARLFHFHLSACKEFEYMTPPYWYCHLRYASTPSAHIVGTCKMGPNPLEGAVVDHQLKVHGIENLRVADASIMPLIPSAHTNAASMMIGEKAAHMIRE